MSHSSLSTLGNMVKRHCTSLALVGSVAIASTTGLLALGCYSDTCKLADGRQATDLQVALIRFGGSVAMVGMLLVAYNNRTNAKLDSSAEVSKALALPFDSLPLLDICVNQQKHPHVMVIGKTGSGKSTLAQWLVAQCPGKRFVIAPHYDPNTSDWSACDAVFAVGRNYGTPDDEPIAYDDLVNGRVSAPTASQCVQAIVKEMDRRYNSPLPQESHPVHNWLLDEVPAIAAELDKAFGNNLRPILFEARKVGLRLFLLTQSDNVETLKVKGQGKLRDQFTYVYLATNASARLRQLKRRMPVLPADTRIAVVDETIALLPTVDELRQVETRDNRFIADFRESRPELPKPSQLCKQETVTEAQYQALAIAVSELLSNQPDLTPNQIAKALKFNGEYNRRGTAIVKEVLANWL